LIDWKAQRPWIQVQSSGPPPFEPQQDLAQQKSSEEKAHLDTHRRYQEGAPHDAILEEKSVIALIYNLSISDYNHNFT